MDIEYCAKQFGLLDSINFGSPEAAHIIPFAYVSWDNMA